MYKDNIQRLFRTFRKVLPEDTLFIWTTALPVSDTVTGGVILPTIRFMSDVLRYDILLANDFASQAAASCGFDVVDLHFEMRRDIALRMADGIHWHPKAHRKITGLLFHHICSAWHVILPSRIAIAFGSLRATAGQKRKPDRCSSVCGDRPNESCGAVSDYARSNLPVAFDGLQVTGERKKSGDSLPLLEEKQNDDGSLGAMPESTSKKSTTECCAAAAMASRMSTVPVEILWRASGDPQQQRASCDPTDAGGMQAINLRLRVWHTDEAIIL